MIKQRLLALALCLFFAAAAESVPLWEIAGTKNRVHILGSVHFLRATDYPLPDKIMAVYKDADVVVFEVDLGNIDPLALQSMLTGVAIDPRGKDLADFLGTSNYSSAERLAGDINIDLAMLRPYEPWFAALQITQLRLGQLGFDGTWGIESQLALKANADGKSIAGLETLEQQFDALDSLPAPAQRDFLMQTLEDAGDIEQGLERIIAAWRDGDTVVLEEELLESLADQPDLYDRILVRRNRAWTRQIIGFANGDREYLIVVGALHLVGDDSVIRMLEDAGYDARQIR